MIVTSNNDITKSIKDDTFVIKKAHYLKVSLTSGYCENMILKAYFYSQSVILVAYTAFSPPEPSFGGRYVKPLKFEGQLDEIILEATLKHKDYRLVL